MGQHTVSINWMSLSQSLSNVLKNISLVTLPRSKECMKSLEELSWWSWRMAQPFGAVVPFPEGLSSAWFLQSMSASLQVPETSAPEDLTPLTSNLWPPPSLTLTHVGGRDLNSGSYSWTANALVHSPFFFILWFQFCVLGVVTTFFKILDLPYRFSVI